MEKLTPKEALEILYDRSWGNSYMPPNKLQHCVSCGEVNRKIIEKIIANRGAVYNGLSLDPDHAQSVGILHDIGCHTDRSKKHPITGYWYLLSRGVSEDIARISLTHCYIGGDLNCSGADGILIKEDGTINIEPGVDWDVYDVEFLREYFKNNPYTIYDDLMNLTDLMVRENIIGLDFRLNDVEKRYGTKATSANHRKQAFALLHKFENLMGCTMEEAFPEIKENQREFKEIELLKQQKINSL